MYSYANRICDRIFTLRLSPIGGNIVFLIGIILIAFLAYIVITKKGGTGKIASESALDILKKRYVNGEISQDEYLEKKEILQK